MTQDFPSDRPALPEFAVAPGAAHPRSQIRIIRGFIAGFGEFVLLAVVSVLALGLWSAWQNTSSLLRDESESTIALVQSRIERHLQPAEDQLVHLGSRIERGDIDSANEACLGKYLAGALAGTPRVRSVVFIPATYQELRTPWVTAPSCRSTVA